MRDPGALPAPFEKHPKGIRKFDEWIMAQIMYPEYVQEVFEMQTEFMLKNLEIMSADMFRELYKP